MGLRSRWCARLSVAIVACAVPVASTVLTPPQRPTAEVAFVVPAAVTAPDQGPGVRRVAPRTTIVGSLDMLSPRGRNRRIAVSSAKGSHVWTASSLAEHDLPLAAKRAYRHAAATLARVEPGCRLPWTLLAGIGRVESDHGRYGRSVLGVNGVPRPAIIGIALNGKGPVAAVPDTDHGRFDGDKVWDRAVGPMQFIPSTWRTAGRDGDGDGVKNPNDIDDAALAAGAYLCHGGRDLSRTADVRAAVFSYNPSTYYVDLVTAFARGYRTGRFVIPSPPVAPRARDGVVHHRRHRAKVAHKPHHPAKKARQHATRHPTRKHPHKPATTSIDTGPKPTPKPTHKPEPKPTPKPSPKPTPKPTPTPTPKPTRKLLTAHGPLSHDDTGWHVQGVTLTADDVTDIAARDYDDDGKVEPIAEELDGLAEAQNVVTLTYYAKPFKVIGFGVG